ncbi:MAG TPA: hypothetical protein VHN18_14775, partial [Micromonosporaceae bacterium]|nr:hypothetical protein [Micromonosporaceae bacterium]
MSAYSHADSFVNRDGQTVRAALSRVLDRLRYAPQTMWSVAVRGDGGTRRTRSRPSSEAPTRLLPGKPGSGNTKPVGGRVGTPVRPQVPQPSRPVGD